MGTRLIASCAVMSLSLAASGAMAATPAWKPDRAVEIVVNTAPGNSPDKTARAIQKIYQERRVGEVPVTVGNRPGGGGAVAYGYLNQRPGDGHTIAIASKALLTNHIMGRGPNPADFTPVAHLFGEYVAIAVKADSPIKSGRDLVERLKQDPAAVTFGIATSLGNINHQSVATVLKDAGIDLKKARNVVFQSAVLARTAMLGGHVDVVPMALGTAAGPLQSGQIRLLAVAAPKRVPGLFANEPTWREQGYDVVMSNWRSVIGPKGMGEGQVAYWERALARVVETDEWKKDIEANFWDSDFLGSAATRKLMDGDYAKIRAFLQELDLAGSK
jgi:putative tricarboxylic transport membrane protein